VREASAKTDHPLYQRVKDHIKAEIRTGVWAEGCRVPSESALMASFGASRMTVNRALRELSAEGWLERVQGAGTFVAGQKPHSMLLEIRSIRDEILERGGRHASRVQALEAVGAEPPLAEALAVRAGSRLFHSVVLHLENDTPIQWEERYVNPVFAPDYLAQDFTAITAYDYLTGRGPIEAADHQVEALLPDERQRRALRMDQGEPCLSPVRRTWSGGLIATRSHLMHPGSRFRFIGRQDYRDSQIHPRPTEGPPT